MSSTKQSSSLQEQDAFYVSMGDVIREPPSLDEESHQFQHRPVKSLKQQNHKHLINAFWQMAVPYFRENPSGRRLFALLILLMTANSAVTVLFSYLARDFWSALGDKDVDGFYDIMRRFLIALICLAPINVYYRFQRERLGIHWRQWMTRRILKLYYSNQVYYNLLSLSPSTATDYTKDHIYNRTKIDNPDQRIAEDVKSFTSYSLNFFLTVAVSLIDLAAFSTILFSIKPSLFLSILGFCIFGTLVTFFIGKTLVSLNFEMLQKEADFRYSLVRIRDNAESIAFFRGETIEGLEVSNRFDRVIANAKEIIGAQRNLDFFTTLYNYLTWILPIIVIAPEYFAGNVDLGVVQQSASAFTHVLDDLSIIINEFESLTAFTASVDRLFQFFLEVQAVDPNRSADGPIMSEEDSQTKLGKDGITISTRIDYPVEERIQMKEIPSANPSPSDDTKSKLAMAIHKLSLVTPDRSQVLIESLDLKLAWDQSLLIYGPSGVGKSSLLRAIAGLWTTGTGTIERPPIEDVYFLPQRPYCPLGTLRSQLMYPSHSVETENYDSIHRSFKKVIDKSDADLLEILASVNLIDLATRLGHGEPLRGLDCVVDWSNLLSLGEQQRLAFGRILVNQPRLVIIDESTSAMDVASEEQMYKLLNALPCTYISVGHRPTLLAFHDLRLNLEKPSNETRKR